MDEGIEAATEPAPEPAAEPAVAPVPGSNEALAAEQETPPPAADAAPEPDADTEKEITDLGIKNDKTAARFRELTAEVKALAPIKAELEKAGIKDVAELPALVRAAKDGTDLVAMVQETGASPDQFGMTLDYLGLITKAGQGDRAAAEKAFEVVGKEYAELAKALGKELPGVYDPLAEHADLSAAIEAGDMTRKAALEVVAARNATKLQGVARERQQAEAQTTQAQQAALTQGRDSLNALEAELMAADPQYAAKRPALVAKVAEIRQQFPPAQWAAAARLAYQGIVVAAPAAPAKPAPGPMRPGGPRPAIAPAVFDDPDAALDAGIAAASR